MELMWIWHDTFLMTSGRYFNIFIYYFWVHIIKTTLYLYQIVGISSYNKGSIQVEVLWLIFFSILIVLLSSNLSWVTAKINIYVLAGIVALAPQLGYFWQVQEIKDLSRMYQITDVPNLLTKKPKHQAISK